MKLRQGFVSNSSTSSFICNTDKSMEQIENELKDIWHIYKTGKNAKMREGREQRSFDDVFRLLEIDKDYVERNSYYGISDSDIGKIAIESRRCNSIDYNLFSIISDKFNATRYHFG